MKDYTKWLHEFHNIFDTSGEEIRLFFAPGRVNLIGEHTDYTGGYVFPAALSYGTWAFARARRDGLFRFASTGFSTRTECFVNDLVYRTEDDWTNYPKGMARQFIERGIGLNGADMLFHGNIPNGAGLSSSASIELVTGVALASIEQAEIPTVELVKMAQRAENTFIGVNCGIMDQFAVGMGRMGQAMLLKCDTLQYRYVPLELGVYNLVITNSNKRRGLADSKYNERRSECEAGFAAILPYTDAASLGDISIETWRKVQHHITDETIRRRVEHVVTENARVLSSMEALQNGDLIEFGERMKQSHISLRDLFEVTGAHLDVLFDSQRQIEGCIGTRMTGAGFGGCTVSLVHRESIDHFKQTVTVQYKTKTGLTPTFYTCDVGAGAREIKEVEICQF
ncbi:galactokinase [Aneurinibacillus terranovensis]|uniref:galactokinase n=1 Tax=Aneurinibacillus terranovensis TaxID=278991 RepID=UPI00040C05FD|nr:galactokinase [Aneurinibacillus terranovensis]